MKTAAFQQFARVARPVRRVRTAGTLRGGFTLVEMMVSITLVLLMMLMFAQVYSLATDTIGTQRGIAENDQRARILATLIRNDLQNRTFRDVVPFRAEPTPASLTATPELQGLLDQRKGYFSFSENDPNLDTDDVLQFTVGAAGSGYGQAARHYGRALMLPNATAGASPPPEQPEFDDGLMGNGTSMSRFAEVAYFMRNGNLYRTSLLVREPYFTASSATLANPAGPIAPASYSTMSYTRFWLDFDFSAFRRPASTDFAIMGPGGLNNDPQANAAILHMASGGDEFQTSTSLGVPHLRYGGRVNTLQGWPVEYGSGTTNNWLGRLTAAERALPSISYPGSSTSYAPFAGTIGTVASYETAAQTNGSVSGRRGADLLLNNVQSFDVEVWDDVVGGWVDLGHSEPKAQNPYKPAAAPTEYGFFHNLRKRTAEVNHPDPATYNPAADDVRYDYTGYTEDTSNATNRYDTWHPGMRVWVDANGNSTVDVGVDEFYRNGRAPYRPLFSNPDKTTTGTLIGFDDPTFVEPAFGSADEAPLRGVRIVVRYLDVASSQTRQVTLEESFID